MSVCWKAGNNEPISHLEDLIHEIISDTIKYHISVNEERLNGKIQTIKMIAFIDEGD